MTLLSDRPQSELDLPSICGREAQLAEIASRTEPVFLPESDVNFRDARGAFAIALHMHQPLIPAGSGGGDLQTANVISNLQFMLEHPEIPDAHNAGAFLSCYRRMGEIIPQLVDEGLKPRVMLDYSGCLLHGLRLMGAGDVIDALRPLATEPRYRRCVEWLGTAWGHAVAPSTPPQDFRLHVLAWQHEFAAAFGDEALFRVRGFSPPEMALPNHPDICYEFVRTLRECGYRWLLVQEHTIERIEDGGAVQQPHLPHRLIARNSSGQTQSIVVLIKTQGSDTKLVGQMQPYYEAKTLNRVDLHGHSVPQLVTQIGDGENGGVMMNEFPPKFMQTIAEAHDSQTPPMTGTEYLEHLAASGVREEDFPMVQPIFQHRIWNRLGTETTSERVAEAIEQLRQEDVRFHVEGGSWTDNISWVRGYTDVLGPMQAASAAFAERMTRGGIPTTDGQYRSALYHLLTAQTSCFRYWGQGQWTEYGRELCRRAVEAAAGGGGR